MKLFSKIFCVAVQIFEIKYQYRHQRCFHQSTVILLSLAKNSPPLSSFALYVQEKKDEIKRENKVVGGNFLKFAANQWKSLPATDKQHYADHAQKLKEEHKKFSNKLTEFEKIQIKTERNQEKEAKLKRKRKKMKVSLGRPKQPLSAYKLFMKDMYANKQVNFEGKSIGNASQQVKATWNSLSFESKKEFHKLALQDKERYFIEMENYVRRLRKEGLEELIPKKYKTLWLQPKLETTWESLVDADWPSKQ